MVAEGADGSTMSPCPIGIRLRPRHVAEEPLRLVGGARVQFREQLLHALGQRFLCVQDGIGVEAEVHCHRARLRLWHAVMERSHELRSAGDEMG